MSEPIVEQKIQELRTFELHQEALRSKNERRLRWLAIFTSLLSLILALGYWLIMPLKREVPYVVVVDAQSGNSHVARLDNSLYDSKITTNDALNKSHVARFVLARESYDWGTVNQQNWKALFSMAAKPVADNFRNQFSSTNPDNPDTVWGKLWGIRIKINSIVLLGKEQNKNSPTSASVRFDRIQVKRDTGQETLLDRKIATIDFTYDANIKMSEEARLNNPLGFQVLRYATDADLTDLIQNKSPVTTTDSDTSRPSQPIAPTSDALGNTAPTSPLNKASPDQSSQSSGNAP